MDAASSDHVRRVNREDLRTSLADLHEICGCAFAVVSTSEFGHDPTWEFPESVTSHRGLGSQRPYTAPTMKILQDLPASLRSDVSFSNLVDFKGSSSAEFCSSRIRCVMDGLVIRCDRDFDRDLRSAFKDEEPPEEGWTEDALREQAILHSAWMIFWRGKVFGGLTAMLATMQSHATPPVNMQADRHVNFINPKLCAKARVIVAISIDGGKITEVEKNVLPKLILDVLSDIRRRQYTWATNTWIIWAQFQNPVQLLKSMNGERNLRPDMRERYQFAMDQTWTPFTYVAVDDTEEKKQLLAKDRIPRPMSLLDRERQMSVESVMQSSLLDTTAANSLVSACMNFPDKSAVDFLLDRHRAIDRVMAYYQLAVRVGHSPTMATPVSVDGDSVIVGSAAEVTSGIAWGLDLAPLTADSALACYADTSASEHGRCRVVWSPSYAPQDEPFVCSGGSECRKIFTAPPPELPGEVQNLATSNPSLGVVHVSWAIAIINVRAPEIYRYELSNDNFNTSIVEVANSATSYTFTSEFPIERRPYSVRSINIAGYSPVQQEFVRADYIGCATRASLLAMHSLNFQTVVLGAASSRDACRLACRAECMRNFGIFGHDAGAGTAKCVCGNMTNVPTVPGCALCALSGDETASGCGDASGSLVSIYDSGTPVRVVIPPMDWFHDYAVTATYEEPLGGYPVVNIKNDSWTQSWLGGTPPVTVFFDAGRPVIVEGFRTKMGPDANLKSYRDFIVKCQTTSNPADAYTVSAGTGGDHTEENGYYWNEYWFDDKTTCQRWQFVMTNSHKPGDGVGIQAFDFYATEEVCV
eukprot:TRINITY_DN21270_c1_g7_i2.p1 TRINITY_DN21270_c1_g7~~TRINITY_DN21270_c1_g7_i2.p1  ORF type:complete len:811 (+),score=78.53 TRINITY_DN21270_c1_g7_i2:131-2563(+)